MTPVEFTLYEERRSIAAEVSVVFELLCTASGLQQWIAADADVDPRPGGRIAWTHDNGDRMQGRFVELEAPHRLVFTYGWADGAMGVAPESTVVEITLTAVTAGTELHLVHRQLPASAADRHAQGWRYFLSRLAEIAR